LLVRELILELRKRKLPYGDRKAVLVSRLREAVRKEHGTEPEEERSAKEKEGEEKIDEEKKSRGRKRSKRIR